METFIAFFDILGFKEIIKNNSLQEMKRLFDNLLRDAGTAVSEENNKLLNPSTIIPDLEHQKVNCLHISDSIVFWTNSNTIQDFENIVNVSYCFYWRSLQTSFPLRGCLTYGEIDFAPFTIPNKKGVAFYNYSLFGKGLVDAYEKAESIEFAGCLLDQLAIVKVSEKLINDLIYNQKICMYKVPFKTGYDYAHVFRPLKGSPNEVKFRNTANRIKVLFTSSSKADLTKLSESVKSKMNNTIDFINYFRETNKDLKRPTRGKNNERLT